MKQDGSASRRSFLRAAVVAPVMGTIAIEPSKNMAQVVPPLSVTTGSAVVSRVKLNRELYDAEGVLKGQVRFRLPASGPVVIRWIDSFGRIAAETQAEPSPSGVAPQNFSFDLSRGLSYRNSVRVWVNGVEQTEGADFMLSPLPRVWDDFHVIMWAGYPDGFYDKLREAGVDGTIAYRDEDFSPILDNNFNFYVEQMMWEVFSIYHKNQPLWRGLLVEFERDRDNMELWVRKPCVNDPKTDEYVRNRLTAYVKQHRAFRPLFYNIADELGQGDQIRPNDFCHSAHCTTKFAEYLRQQYGAPVANAAREWSVGEITRWDDLSVRNGARWLTSNLMINYTTTDRAFDAIAVAALKAKYVSLAGLNAAWGVDFPAPRGGANDPWAWAPVLAAVSDTRSIPDLTEAALERVLGPIAKANERWGSQTSWGAPDKPAGFQSWSQVVAFITRFYKELSEVRSVDGWNVSPWCDFRNFMDLTFAEAIQRARAVCKAEDPYALCSTEGGQIPFAFGWYNYENVVKSVDVIEPYTSGGNVEVIRSLNSKVIMVSTHDFEYQPGKPLTDSDRVRQKRSIRPIWWGLFHGHRGSLIWDNLLPHDRFVGEDRQLTPAAKTFSPLFHELRGGIGKLFINSQRQHDGIAIHYSQASMQIHWLLDNVKNAREWMLHSSAERFSHITGLRNSWIKLVEDLGLQYEFVGRGSVEKGALNLNQYRAFIMPQSLAVSAREAEEIRRFVNTGGLLIADCRAALMNEHGRALELGQLDEVFGVSRGASQTVGKRAAGVASFESLHLQGKQLTVTVGDDAVRVSSGKPLAQSGEVPLVIVHEFGKGKAVFLNTEISSYAFQRLQSEPLTSLPQIMEGVFSLAGIAPHIRALNADGQRCPGTEIVRFANGGYEHVAIFRNPQVDDSGWGNLPTQSRSAGQEEIDNSLLERAANVTISWGAAMQTYDVRAGKDLGKTAESHATLDPWEPLVFTRSAGPVPRCLVKVPDQVQAGSVLTVTVTDEAALPEGSFRIVRLELLAPGGQPYELYARNLLVRLTPHAESIPLAFNDPKGRWRVRARDVMTGEVQESAFTVV